MSKTKDRRKAFQVNQRHDPRLETILPGHSFGSLTVDKLAKPGASGNRRVWASCVCGRRLTVRANKVKDWDCAKCRRIALN